MMIKKILSITLIIAAILSLASCKVKEKEVESESENTQTQPVSYTKPVTKIYNDLADTLPEFSFENELHETYDEGYSYSFSVEASQSEFEDYTEAVKESGYSSGQVSGENYYFAMNANGFKLECMYTDGDIVVSVSR